MKQKKFSYGLKCIHREIKNSRNLMNYATAEIITIGDEILYGQTLDTNTQWMSVELDKIGIKIVRRTTIGDTEEAILTAFAEAESRADLVLITGGLGPTPDDLTKPCLAKYFQTDLILFEEALTQLTAFFESRGRELNALNRTQAFLPATCTMIPNTLGTAPGMWLERNGKVFVSMPGVPHEMRQMMTATLLAKISATFQTPIFVHKMVKTVGIPESVLAEKVANWEQALPDFIKLAYLPSLGQVRLRLTATGENKQPLERAIAEQIHLLKIILGKYIYGYDDDRLEEVVGRMLKTQHKTIALAESCTGGFISHMITSVPGSSEYFRGAIVPYHNDLKIKLLEVPESILTTMGAVSEETVRQMSEHARLSLGADIGLAISGIAGPGGATPDKPVGTIWIAVATEKSTVAKRLQLTAARDVNIKLTAVAALNMVRQTLSEID
jgi:nicotinamide-nucleotide amidase